MPDPSDILKMTQGSLLNSLSPDPSMAPQADLAQPAQPLALATPDDSLDAMYAKYTQRRTASQQAGGYRRGRTASPMTQHLQQAQAQQQQSSDPYHFVSQTPGDSTVVSGATGGDRNLDAQAQAEIAQLPQQEQMADPSTPMGARVQGVLASKQTAERTAQLDAGSAKPSSVGSLTHGMTPDQVSSLGMMQKANVPIQHILDTMVHMQEQNATRQHEDDSKAESTHAKAVEDWQKGSTDYQDQLQGAGKYAAVQQRGQLAEKREGLAEKREARSEQKDGGKGLNAFKFGGNTPAAPTPTHVLNGRPIALQNNAWVFVDTGEAAK